jgi:hypothetical protein
MNSNNNNEVCIRKRFDIYWGDRGSKVVVARHFQKIYLDFTLPNFLGKELNAKNIENNLSDTECYYENVSRLNFMLRMPTHFSSPQKKGRLSQQQPSL